MHRTTKLVAAFVILAVLVVPVFALAQNGLIPCGTEVDDKGLVTNPCGFKDFLALINNVIGFIFQYLILPIAAILFAFAGFKLVFSGGSTEARGTAKKVFTNTAIGLIIALSAFLIIRTLLSILGYEGAWIGFENVI